MQNTEKKLKFFNQEFDEEIFKNLKKKLKDDSWINGKNIDILEKKLAKYLNTNKKVCSCNSGSDALMLSLLLDKHKTKDIYLTTPYSYIASSSIAKFLNLKIIYIDVEKNNFLLDLNSLENFLLNCPKKIKKRLRGIINVEIFGFTNNLVKLKSLSKKFNLSLIGDCAQSFGAYYKNKTTVNYYDYSVLSFYPTKIYSCYGDGGALILNKKKLNKAILLKNNGHKLKKKENCYVLGINSRLDNIQAYILNNRLNKLNSELETRKFNSELLKKNNPSFLKLPEFDNNVLSNNYIYAVYIKKNLREKFIKYMLKNNIECVVYYKKLLNENKTLRPIMKTKLNNATNCAKSLVCIPTNHKISKIEILKISNVIKNFKYN